MGRPTWAAPDCTVISSPGWDQRLPHSVMVRMIASSDIPSVLHVPRAPWITALRVSLKNRSDIQSAGEEWPGHAAFLGLERTRQIIGETGLDYEAARHLTASSSVFTTHTPVPAGFDLFDTFIEWCRTHGLYVILDLHGAPGAQSDGGIADSDGEAPPSGLSVSSSECRRTSRSSTAAAAGSAVVKSD